MTKNEFFTRFNLKQLPLSEHAYRPSTRLRDAAVLITLVEPKEGAELEVVLTKRASHLKHHPSQISFPGGKVEQEDSSPIETALRESFEEIGLLATQVTIAGQLLPYQTASGFSVKPVVAFVESIPNYQIDTNEVAEVFHVPLKFFLHTNDHHTVVISKNGQKHDVHFYPYKHYNIWGATAVMIKDLVNQLS